jgi:hypothetical protein
MGAKAAGIWISNHRWGVVLLAMQALRFGDCVSALGRSLRRQWNRSIAGSIMQRFDADDHARFMTKIWRTQEAVKSKIMRGLCAADLARCPSEQAAAARVQGVLEWLRQEDVLTAFEFVFAWPRVVRIRWAAVFPMLEREQTFILEEMRSENVVVYDVMGS